MSPARWAGVAFVIVAILAAIVLGVISPSESAPAPGVAMNDASPSPSPTTADTRVPEAKPRITFPSAGKTNEIETLVTVDVPDERLKRGELTLVVMRGEEELERVKRPKPGTTVEVKGVRLVEGPNELSAALLGPDGPGPRSEPVLVTVDRTMPELAITAPKNKIEMYEDTVEVEGTSEVGAEVRVKNAANGHSDTVIVGPSGEFSMPIRLKVGVNKITATSVDEAEIPDQARVRIKRLDGKPKVRIRGDDRIRRSRLPTQITIKVDVTDGSGKPMPEAQVEYQLGGQDRTTVPESDVTNAKGRARWQVKVERSSSPADALELVVTVTSPLTDQKATATKTIAFVP